MWLRWRSCEKMEKNWFAIYVHSRHEKKVASLLESKSIEHYLPVQKVTRQWSDRKKTVIEPLFKSYVFVKVSENEKESIRMTSGVINFVYWLGKPAVIREEEIETIKQFIEDYQNIEIENLSPEVNSSIRIGSGPFANQIGKVITVKNTKIKLFIESLGCYLVADITKNKVLNLPAIK